MKGIEKFVTHYDKLVGAWYKSIEKASKDIVDEADMCKEKVYDEFYREYRNLNGPDVFLENLPGYFDITGMPEPYFGNPEECSAVIININPGQVIETNSYFKRELPGNILKKYLKDTDKYGEMASGFPYLDPVEIAAKNKSAQWYNRRKKWIKRLVEIHEEQAIKEDIPNPFALEMCPWHSKEWKDLNYNEDVYDYVKDYLVNPAKAAVANSRLPFALCIGSPVFEAVKSLMEQMGYNPVVKIWNPGDLKEWPLNSNGDYVKRWYAFIKTTEISFLCTWNEGSNEAPGGGFVKMTKKGTKQTLEGVEYELLKEVKKI